MAYAKKASSFYPRRSYRKRTYRRRWARSRYRRKYRRRYYKKPEYKRIETGGVFTFAVRGLERQPGVAATSRLIMTNPYIFTLIGTGVNNPATNWGVDIPQGAGINQRIGAKINPARIKFQVTLALNPNFIEVPQQQALDVTELQNAVSFKFRFIVMQVKTGAGNKNPIDIDFSNINPYVTNGNVDTGFFNKAFTCGDPGYFVDGDFSLSPENLPNLYNLMTSPYRRGLGGQFKVLKDKVYSLDSQKGTFYTFKFKTKKPQAMVWVEHRNNANEVYTFPKNPIYIICIPTPNMFNNKASAQINWRYEFAYTDV